MWRTTVPLCYPSGWLSSHSERLIERPEPCLIPGRLRIFLSVPADHLLWTRDHRCRPGNLVAGFCGGSLDGWGSEVSTTRMGLSPRSLPVIGSARRHTTTEEVDKASQSSVPIVVGKRLAWVSKGETAEHDDDAKTQDGDWTETARSDDACPGRGGSHLPGGTMLLARSDRQHPNEPGAVLRGDSSDFERRGSGTTTIPGPSVGSGTTTTSPSARITG